MNVAEYIVRYVEYRGTEHAYVIVGGAALWICKALGQSSKLKFTFVNHEQAAVMGADGYARMSGKAGVAFVTNGPALTNTVTGMAQAYVDSSPVVLFTGDSNSRHVAFEGEHDLRQYGTQDVKTHRIMEPVTKKVYTLTDPAKTGEVLAEAFYLAENGRPGPVCVHVPIDIQSSACPCAFPPVWTPPAEPEIPAETVEGVLTALRNAKRPLILAGQGVRLSGMTDLFRKLLPAIDAPVTNARMGIDTIETDNPYYVGRCGNHGFRSAHFALQTCDVLLVLGSRLAPNTTGYNVADFAKQAKKILVEVDPAELVQYGVKIDENIRGDLKDFLAKAEALLAAKPELRGSHGRWVSVCRDWLSRYPVVQEKYFQGDVINSYQLVDTVTRLAGDEDIAIADTGSSCSIVAQAWRVRGKQRVLISGGLSAMGYWATSLGLAEGNRGRGQVLCFVGDGALQMNIQEFATLAAYRIPVKIFLVSNDGYQFVRMSQGGYNINPPFGTDASDGVPIPDMEKVTKAYGLKYLSCREPAMLENAVRETLAAEGPTVCEVFVSKNLEVEPRLKSVARPDGTFGMPSYENLYPNLPEDVLKAEMAKAFTE
ncbi:MAG: thiamine pyrophosphate-binding protein [Clostridia bacterium]|nr:thiamine pyrophosphate-binding protein [Clostridia bacterium]